ncbi:MAG: DUF5119 domain-containing protein [Alistipes sp.]
MRRYGIYIMLLLCLASSCERDHLYYGANNKAIIGLRIDWSQAQLKPNGATVVAYGEDGALFEAFPYMSNPNYATIALPEGSYDVLIYNNTPGEYRSVAFRGMERMERYEAYAMVKEPLRRSIGRSGAEDVIVADPDTLATARVMGLKITSDMIQYYYNRPDGSALGAVVAEVAVVPERAISVATIRAHVKGLCYAASAPVAHLRNMSGGFYLGLGQNSACVVTHEFILNNRTFNPGSTTDGMICNQITTFGLLTPESVRAPHRYYLDVDFMLVDGQKYPVSIDITDRLKVARGVHTQLTVEVEIELPKAIGGGGGGAFDTGVGEWNDTTVEIPM